MIRRSLDMPTALALSCLVSLGACSSQTSPSRPAIAVSLPAAVEGRYVACATCAEPTVTVVLEFPVTVSDPNGPGGTVERLTTILMNRTRAAEVGRNVRPNADYAFPSTALPAAGQLTLQAGLVVPPPPPRDDLAVTVQVRLTDGREASATGPLAVLPASPGP